MIKFTDTRPGQAGSSPHACPNESLQCLRKALATAEGPLKNGGSICSGGEVPLGVVLPVVDYLQIVDHNYGSLFYGLLKILAVKHLTNDQLRGFFSERRHGEVRAFVEAHQDEFPSQLLMNRPGYLSSNSISAYWTKDAMPDAIIDAARKKLDCIELVHGDAGDLTKGLDVFYISNALNHSPVYANSRDMTGTANKLMNAIEHQMRYGGYLLATAMHEGDKRFKFVVNGGPDGMWQVHGLYQKVGHKPAEVAERFRYMTKEVRFRIQRKDNYGYDYFDNLKSVSVGHADSLITPKGYRRATV